jgi:DNA invertase Pin-like site-specific DNA recombinase
MAPSSARTTAPSTSDRPRRAALYARVSTHDQTCENQLLELRRYCEARGWTTTEYVDIGVSGAKDRRPALDRLMADASARHVDVVVCWRLDRFGRNLRHLVTAIEELATAGVAFVSMGESIDTASPTGRLLLGVLASFAEFERERIRERIHAGLARARRQGQKLGRKRQRIGERDLERVAGLSVREAARVLGLPASRIHRERGRLFQNPSGTQVEKAPPIAGSEAPGGVC